jgi:signal transduction histidine kinase
MDGSQVELGQVDLSYIDILDQRSQQSSIDVERGLYASMAAHELREPIQAIQGFLSVILRERVGSLNDVQRDFLRTSYLASRRMERLINDVQVMYGRDQGFTIKPETTDLLTHAETCCRELGPIAESRGLRILVDAPGSGPWSLYADPTRLDQIILNLVENAIRYSSAESTIQVRLRQGGSRLLLVVENETEHRASDPKSWFEPFRRGHLNGENQHTGLGLGLTVVRHLVEAHHGKIITRLRGNRVSIGVVLPADNRLVATMLLRSVGLSD